MPPPPPDPAPAARAASHRILLVNHHPVNRAAVARLLVAEGFAVLADEGDAGAGADLVLIDLDDAGADSELAARVRALAVAHRPRVPVLALAGDAGAIRHAALGLDAVIAKPVEPAQLVLALRQQLALAVAASSR